MAVNVGLFQNIIEVGWGNALPVAVLDFYWNFTTFKETNWYSTVYDSPFFPNTRLDGDTTFNVRQNPPEVHPDEPVWNYKPYINDRNEEETSEVLVIDRALYQLQTDWGVITEYIDISAGRMVPFVLGGDPVPEGIYPYPADLNAHIAVIAGYSGFPPSSTYSPIVWQVIASHIDSFTTTTKTREGRQLIFFHLGRILPLLPEGTTTFQIKLNIGPSLSQDNLIWEASCATFRQSRFPVSLINNPNWDYAAAISEQFIFKDGDPELGTPVYQVTFTVNVVSMQVLMTHGPIT